MQRWFRHTKFSSFQRQLNIYGFSRIPEGPDTGSYYHKYFVRGQYEEILKMERNAIKGTVVRRPRDAGSHPDFYRQHQQRASAVTAAPVFDTEQLNPHFAMAPTTTQLGILSATFPNGIGTNLSQGNHLIPDLPYQQSILQQYLALQTTVAAGNNNDNPPNIQLARTNAIPEMLLERPRFPNAPWPQMAPLAPLDTLSAAGALLLRGLVVDPLPQQQNLVQERMLQAQALTDALHRRNVTLSSNQSLPSHPYQHTRSNSLSAEDILNLIQRQERDPRGSHW